MTKYIGETPVDITTHPEFKDMTPAKWAVLYAWQFGQIDGAHHKQWVIDQMTRILLGAPVTVSEAHWDNGNSEFRYEVGTSDEYEQWVKRYIGPDEENGDTWSYDEGIAP